VTLSNIEISNDLAIESAIGFVGAVLSAFVVLFRRMAVYEAEQNGCGRRSRRK